MLITFDDQLQYYQDSAVYFCPARAPPLTLFLVVGAVAATIITLPTCSRFFIAGYDIL